MLRRIIRDIRRWRASRRRHTPVITVEVSKGALLNNLKVLRNLVPEWSIAPVLKSNAYGHGMIVVTEILETVSDIPFICLDSHFEAHNIRNRSIKKSLLVLGFTPTNTIAQSRLKSVAYTIGTLEQLRDLIEQGVKQSVHIKFDTGMHRQGIDPEAVYEIIALINSQDALKVEGILSHFADADGETASFTDEQIRRWNDLAQRFKNEVPSVVYFHISNSAGLSHHDKIEANVARAGRAFYGTDPGNLNVKLKPALSMKSLISEIRILKKGESIGYNNTFTAEKDMKVATVPVGFFEGVDRRLSNEGAFLIEGKEAPIVGRVSMNISSCDVTDISEAKIGSEVTIISDKREDKNSIENIAEICGTIPYEILVHIPAHLSRVAQNLVD